MTSRALENARPQPGQRGERHLHALLVYQPPGDHQQRTIAGIARPRRQPGPGRGVPGVGVQPVGHDLDLIGRQIEQAGAPRRT